MFTSAATDLVAGDMNGATDVFARDFPNTATTLVSVNAAGTASGNGASSPGVPNGPGGCVAFTSAATDLVASDNNGAQDVFVRDLKRSATTLASINNAGTGSGNGGSTSPAIDRNCHSVAFVNDATNLVAADQNGMTEVSSATSRREQRRS